MPAIKARKKIGKSIWNNPSKQINKIGNNQLNENARNLLFFFIKKLKLNSINLNQSQVNKPYRKNIWSKFPKNKFDRVVIEIPPSNIPKDNKKDSDGWLLYRADKFFFKYKIDIKIEKTLFFNLST